MLDRFCTNNMALPQRFHVPLLIGVLVTLLGFLLPGQSIGQAPSASAYPNDSASAGMTSGLPNGLTAQQLELMRARSAAQSSQGHAVAASMARSADQTIESQHQQKAIQSAREIKALKREMAERMKWERSNEQVNKVSANDLSSWKTQTGNVKVEREVPNTFMTALIEEERLAAERGEDVKKEKKGIKWNPFKKDESKDDEYGFDPADFEPIGFIEPDPEPIPEPKKKEGGLFSGFKMPLVGNSDKEKVSQSTTAASEPVFNQTNNSRQPTASAQSSSSAASRPSTIVPGRSGVAMMQREAEEASETVSFSESIPEVGKKPGLFSKLGKSNGGSSGGVPSSGGGGFMAFGKKKSNTGTIDASLFPEDAVSQAPTGGSLSGGYTEEQVAEDSSFAPSSTGDIVMPGESQKKGGFSFPKPSLSIPSFGLSSGSDKDGSGNVPTLSTINSMGTDYYSVTSTAQFMVYGDTQTSSEVRALASGTLVRMTKPGEQWASVRLPGGSEGLIQNKFLTPASASQAGGQFSGE